MKKQSIRSDDGQAVECLVDCFERDAESLLQAVVAVAVVVAVVAPTFEYEQLRVTAPRASLGLPLQLLAPIMPVPLLAVPLGRFLKMVAPDPGTIHRPMICAEADAIFG